jgi:hypothetical protein
LPIQLPIQCTMFGGRWRGLNETRTGAEHVKYDLRRPDDTGRIGFLNRVRRFESFRGHSKVQVSGLTGATTARPAHPVAHPSRTNGALVAWNAARRRPAALGVISLAPSRRRETHGLNHRRSQLRRYGVAWRCRRLNGVLVTVVTADTRGRLSTPDMELEVLTTPGVALVGWDRAAVSVRPVGASGCLILGVGSGSFCWTMFRRPAWVRLRSWLVLGSCHTCRSVSWPLERS